MNFSYLVGLLLLGLVWCDENTLQDITKKADSSEEDISGYINTIQKYVDEKCQKQNGESKDVKKLLVQLQECLDDHVPNTASEIKQFTKDRDSSEEICADAGKPLKVRECFGDVIDLWQDCSDPEEKYVPEFFFDGIENLYNFACADEGKNFLKLINNSSMECFEILSEIDNLEDVCDNKLEKLKIASDIDVISKADLCEGLTVGKTCFADVIRTKCPNDNNVRELYEGVMTAISVPCTK